MTLDPNINTLEKAKFRDAGSSLSKVAVEIENSGSISVSDFANISGISGKKTITTTQSTAYAASSNLSGRRVLMIEPKGGNVYWSFNSGFTAVDGHKLSKDSIVSIPVGDSINVYLRTSSGSTDVTISEAK